MIIDKNRGDLRDVSAKTVTLDSTNWFEMPRKVREVLGRRGGLEGRMWFAPLEILHGQSQGFFFQPKHRLGHPENNLISLSKKYIFRIKVSKKQFMYFWK